MRFTLFAVALTFVVQGHATAQSLESFASEIVVFGPNDFLHGFRPSSSLPLEARTAIRRFTQFLEKRPRRAGDLLPLLKHRDPKVRTLALVAVYDLEDPKLLPEISSLVDDPAQTFPTVYPTAHIAWPPRITPEWLRPQTVGDIATAIVNIYLERGGFHYGPGGIRGQPGFREYWSTRGHRTSVAGWWGVRLARASHSSSPTPEAQRPAIRKLRAEIDRLPEPDRTYVLLWLRADYGAGVLVTDAELLDFLQKLGTESVVDMLERKIRTDDPDLQPRPANNYRYSQMCLFVLRHAKTLLRPEHSTLLLAQEMWERDHQKWGISDPMIDAWWAIAAAQLDATSAPAILRAAFARFQDDYQGPHRLELVAAVWRLNGDAATAVDWFYQQLQRPMSQEAYYLGRILTDAERPPHPFMKVLINDARFNELNWRSLEVLAKTLNVVSDEELRSTWSPSGIDFYFKDRSKMMAEYPKETEQLLTKLAAWRAALRQAASAL